MPSGSRHENYDILNLIGYGLAKFNMEFVQEMGFRTKSALYTHLVQLGVAETTSTIKNRQDLFDPFFENGRSGWWQKGNAYIHRKNYIDSLFGSLNCRDFVGVVRLSLESQNFLVPQGQTNLSPIITSRFRQLQQTGQEAELFFMNNFIKIPLFTHGELEDARLLGDGYDFQLSVDDVYYLAEIKGVRTQSGSIRMTEREYQKAQEFGDNYALVVVSNLNLLPVMNLCLDPVRHFDFAMQVSSISQTYFTIPSQKWNGIGL